MSLTDRFTVQTVTAPSLLNSILGTGDFNGDGRTDIILGRYTTDGRSTQPLTLALSKADGTYAFKTLTVTAERPYVETGDFNGDGKLDVALFDAGYYDNVGGHGGPPQLLLGDGAGGFTASQALANAVAAYPGGAIGPRSPDADLHVKDIVSGDIDGDGDLDFWLESSGGDNINDHFMINNGDGTFRVDDSRVSRVAISGDRPAGDFFRYQVAELVDMNGDGKLDLLLGQIRDNDRTHINQYSIVIYNDGKGFFPLENRVNLPHPDFYYGYTAVLGMAAGDLNGDGRKDLVIVHTRNDGVIGPQEEPAWQGRYVQVLIARPDGSYVDETAARIGDQSLAAKGGGELYNNPRQVLLMDLDQDGDLDIVTAGNGTYWQAGATYAYMNNGQGAFTAADGAFYTDGQPWYGEGGYFIDLNRDGRQDFVHIDIEAGANGKWEGNSVVSDDVAKLYIQTATTRFTTAQTATTATVNGTPGDDNLTGGAGDERFVLGAGADRGFGEGGNDTLDGGDGQDYLRGGDGNDSILGGADFDDVHGNAGDDSVSGGAGGDWVVGGKDNDWLSGDDGDDVVYGNLGNDTGLGGAGNDWVRGGQGDDSLSGGAGDDWISGDRGNDTLSGGLGADIFNTFADMGQDRVTDFNAAEGDRVKVEPGNTYSVAQSGADVIVTLQGGQITLQNVQLSTLPEGWIFVG